MDDYKILEELEDQADLKAAKMGRRCEKTEDCFVERGEKGTGTLS